MLNASTGCEPLHISVPVARRGAQRIGMIEATGAHDGDCLKTSVWVRGKPRDLSTVIHVPAIFPRKVHAQLSAGQRSRWPERTVAFGKLVVVVNREQERVWGGPRSSLRESKLAHDDSLGCVAGDRSMVGGAGVGHETSWRRIEIPLMSRSLLTPAAANPCAQSDAGRASCAQNHKRFSTGQLGHGRQGKAHSS